MAIVDITEYQTLASDGAGSRVAAGVEPAYARQQLSVSGVSAASQAMNENTKFVRVHTDSTPTASATSARMVGNSTEYFGVSKGTKIAVIAAV